MKVALDQAGQYPPELSLPVNPKVKFWCLSVGPTPHT